MSPFQWLLSKGCSGFLRVCVVLDLTRSFAGELFSFGSFQISHYFSGRVSKPFMEHQDTSFEACYTCHIIVICQSKVKPIFFFCLSSMVALCLRNTVVEPLRIERAHTQKLALQTSAHSSVEPFFHPIAHPWSNGLQCHPQKQQMLCGEQEYSWWSLPDRRSCGRGTRIQIPTVPLVVVLTLGDSETIERWSTFSEFFQAGRSADLLVHVNPGVENLGNLWSFGFHELTSRIVLKTVVSNGWIH